LFVFFGFVRPAPARHEPDRSAGTGGSFNARKDLNGQYIEFALMLILIVALGQK
jgi:hypothetical protein